MTYYFAGVIGAEDDDAADNDVEDDDAANPCGLPFSSCLLSFFLSNVIIFVLISLNNISLLLSNCGHLLIKSKTFRTSSR